MAERTNLDLLDRKLNQSTVQLNTQLNTQEEQRLQLMGQITLQETILAVEVMSKQMGEQKGITHAVTNAITPNERAGIVIDVGKSVGWSGNASKSMAQTQTPGSRRMSRN